MYTVWNSCWWCVAVAGIDRSNVSLTSSDWVGVVVKQQTFESSCSTVVVGDITTEVVFHWLVTQKIDNLQEEKYGDTCLKVNRELSGSAKIMFQKIPDYIKYLDRWEKKFGFEGDLNIVTLPNLREGEDKSNVQSESS